MATAPSPRGNSAPTIAGNAIAITVLKDRPPAGRSFLLYRSLNCGLEATSLDVAVGFDSG